MTITLSNHSIIRCGQRGIREKYLDLVKEYGTEVEGGYLVTRKDIKKYELWVRRNLKSWDQHITREYKLILDMLTKLDNVFIAITEDGSNLVKTAFRTTKRQRRRKTRRW